MKQSTKSYFPDVNVWLALSYERHSHHAVARRWFDALDDDARIYFSRYTQLGLLRLLTTESVMKDEVMSQKQAWEIYDIWIRDDRIHWAEEPIGVDRIFRQLSQSSRPSAKAWMDEYLAACAIVSGMSMVTFDRGFRDKIRHLVILGES